MVQNNDLRKGVIFPLGDKNDAYQKFFVGQSYLKSLVNDPQMDVSVGVVTFEPGCRNNWHIHHAGFQILPVTGGEGCYQEIGQKPRLLKKGDIIVTHDGVKHWHGATKDSWFAHIAITTGKTEWLEPVLDADYENLEEK